MHKKIVAMFFVSLSLLAITGCNEEEPRPFECFELNGVTACE